MAGSTPIYGFPYPESSDLVANYPALGQDLAEDIEGVIAAIPLGGLSIVTPTSIANSGGSASLSGASVTFTGVNSVSLNGIFTSSYDNYRILIRADKAGSAELHCRLRGSGSDITGSNYSRQHLAANGASVNANTGTDSYIYCTVYGTAGDTRAILEVSNPALAQSTLFLNTSTDALPAVHYVNVRHTLATAYDGLTVYPTTSTITGTVQVYGYKKS